MGKPHAPSMMYTGRYELMSLLYTRKNQRSSVLTWLGLKLPTSWDTGERFNASVKCNLPKNRETAQFP
jgi:hypothetical protein